MFFSLTVNAEIIYLDCKGNTETERTIRVHTGSADKKDFKVYDKILNHNELPIKSESFLYTLDETQNALINISNDPINKYLNKYKKIKERNCIIQRERVVCDQASKVTYEDSSSRMSSSSYLEISRINGDMLKHEISITYDKLKDENDILDSRFSGICKKIDKKAF